VGKHEEKLKELMDAGMRRDIDRRAIAACEAAGGIWPRLPVEEKNMLRSEALAEMMEEAVRESGEFEQLPDGRWKRIRPQDEPVNKITQFVIYDHPKDHPEHFVTRRWDAIEGELFAGPCWLAATIEEARQKIPAGLTCVGRDEQDDSAIAEVWI
jgi:hypothetical protein